MEPSSTCSSQWNHWNQYYIVNVSVAESQQKLQFETSSMSLTLNDLHPFYSHTVIVAAVTVAPGPFSNEFVQKLPPDGKMLKLIQNEENYLSHYCSSQWSSTEH